MHLAFDYSFGQAPWLLDIMWHIPVSKSVHRLRHRSAAMMRRRVQSKDVQIWDLSSYLVNLFFFL